MSRPFFDSDPEESQRLFWPIDGRPMQRVTQMKLYRLGFLSRLRMMKAGDALDDWKNELSNAQFRLRTFAQVQNYDVLPNYSKSSSHYATRFTLSKKPAVQNQ